MDAAEILASLFALFWWIVLIVSFEKDRSRYRNCYFLFIALISTVVAATMFADGRESETLLTVGVLTGIAIFMVPVFLIHNGVVMYKKEGRSLSNQLSLLFGIVIGVGEIGTTYLALTGWETEFAIQHKTLTIIIAVISLSVIYVSVSFLLFLFYSLFLMVIPRKKDFDYVIVHGAGLLDGNKVSKLLADRIDKAILVYSTDPSPTILIPSGGQGGDETVSEAEAMAEYLREKGIPESDILLEDKSGTTMENLKNCKAIIDAREGRKYTALVTSNYHVYRALRYCRKIGLKCTGIGSRVAAYYWPSALIREFVAIHREPKHLISFLAGWAILMVIPFVL